MYRIGICDDDRILCSELEEQICHISGEMDVKAETEVWESGEIDGRRGTEYQQALPEGAPGKNQGT